MSALLRSSEIRRIEALAMRELPAGTLMSRAADAVVEATVELARTLAVGRPIVAWIGPGNNGGDALLAALRLRACGFAVHAIALDTRREPAGDAAAIWQMARQQDFPVAPAAAWGAWLTAPTAPIVVDGLFGIGLQRPLDTACAALCAQMAQRDWPVVAVDVPSGIDADTGSLVGTQAVRARRTVTMIADKPGLRTGAALDHVGTVSVATLGIDAALLDEDPCTTAGVPGATVIPAAAATLSDPMHGTASPAAHERSFVAARGRRFDLTAARDEAPPARSLDSNKGSFGSVLCYGGAPGMHGAVLLAARGAQAGGAGRIYVATPGGTLFDPSQPQWMSASPDTGFGSFDAVAIGCGLGTSGAAADALRRAGAQARALVIDADALNLIAADASLTAALMQRKSANASVATPHPLEAARLLGADVADVQTDRIGAACTLAARLHCVILLKGAGSIVATPQGHWSIIATGSPCLASAGTGDVLAGLCASLLARGLDAERAACLAAWLHGGAGTLWAQANGTDDGLSAACLPRWIRAARAQLPAESVGASPVVLR